MQQYFPTFYRVSKGFPVRTLIAIICAASVGMVAGRALLGRVSVVSGISMSPTYEGGMWVRSVPISGPIERGDVVILNDGSGDYAIKRIVGLPGETLQVWNGYVFVDRKILVEPYLGKHIYTFPRQKQSVFLLGPNQYFVMGDNRPYSADSRMYGPVERGQLKERLNLPESAQRAHFGPTVVRVDNQHKKAPVPNTGEVSPF
jgi:signal peptidase I